ncbi:MAG: glycine--tRNA ligase subunit beta [Pseudomonadota bacterium]
MPELLLELFCEEIPARMQARAADDLRERLIELLDECQFGRLIDVEAVETFVTPRRLTAVARDIPAVQPDVTVEKKGPRVDAPDQARAGFLKSVGLASLDQCEKRMIGKAEFWFAVVNKTGRPSAVVLAEKLPELIFAFDWPKSMRWQNILVSWVRPLHGILAVFDGKPLLGNVGLGKRRQELPAITLPFVDTTRGHRFLVPGAFAVKDFADYKTKLRDHYVILDAAERREIIRRDSALLAEQAGLAVKEDRGLIDELTGLVEWPVVLMGRIDPAHLDLPPEVLAAAMRAHQRYLPLLKPDGSLAPRFLIVANTPGEDGGAAIVRGNERVLRARLADARFFFDHDRKLKLADRVPALKGRIFHAKLGTMADKAMRLEALAAELAAYIPGADMDWVRRAARLCKADLSSGMVGEFPELQGVIGRYYAVADGAPPAVAQAISEHYAPLGPNDRCPSAPTSVAVALADKIDTLVGFFAVGDKPTGSKDPFALRRAALGVIRVILENKLRIPLIGVFRMAARFYEEYAASRAFDAHELLAFFADRMKVHLRDKGVPHDLVAAVFALGGEDDLVRLLARVDALRAFLATDDGANLLTAYRRASNIVVIEEKKDKTTYNDRVERPLLTAPEERKLDGVLDAARTRTRSALQREDFTAAMRELSTLRRPVDAFFDKVTVNCPERELRANRLRLLSAIRRTLADVADFSMIEG